MKFLIADTFTDSLARLTGDEQKAVKTTAFDLQMDPTRPGLSFHKLDRARDKAFWSVRVNADVRLIVHRTDSSLLLCYVDHHDRAYKWAERRKLETHPKTGAAQFVEIREKVQEILVPTYVAEDRLAAPKEPLFADRHDDELLSYGVPPEWLDDVREVDEDALLQIADRLPAEAAEALLELATGGTPRVTHATWVTPFEHPDAQRRFRVLANVEELERALDAPWDKWTVFLHPEQREWVERDFDGPARVSGSAGTGKTIVALHRAVHLARSNPGARVLLATFSGPLGRGLEIRLRKLIGNEPRVREQIEVHAMDAVARRVYSAHGGRMRLADRATVRRAIEAAADATPDHGFSLAFLIAEWEQVIDGWQVDGWEAYRDVPRLGRKTRLPQARREALWALFERVRADLRGSDLITQAGMLTELSRTLAESRQQPFDFAVVDEAQDMSVAQLRFMGALASDRRNGLFFAGDLGQRIFQIPFSWSSLGVEVRGRARTLRVNYRTSHQIRARADRLLAAEVVDVDGNTERRSDTVSVFNGPAPVIRVVESEGEEREVVAGWLAERLKDGVPPHAIGVFVRSAEQIGRAVAVAEAAGAAFAVLDDDLGVSAGALSIATMHLVKGLEFQAVAVIACEDEVVPLQSRIESVGDDADLREVYDTERHLLYVACTRARDHLIVTGVEPASEFLEDMGETESHGGSG